MSGWTEDGLVRAWRALSLQEGGEDWRFVHLTTIGSLSVEVGCHFPGGREAVVVSFTGCRSFDHSRLPEGEGFDVTTIEGQDADATRTAVALVRSAEGSLEIFLLMAVDVIHSLENAATSSASNLLEDFLDRVREWQSFMTRKHRPLSADAQIGLLGELSVLEMLLDTNLGSDALKCWQGPLRSAQDFHVYSGAIEVKSTSGAGGFMAQINSIEQLDADRSPKFLCALRFEETSGGISLLETVSRLRSRLKDLGRLRAFDALLTVMGYLDEHANHYGRPFILREMKGYSLDNGFPRLSRSSLPAAIRSATYVLDLDAVQVPSVTPDDVFESFGLK